MVTNDHPNQSMYNNNNIGNIFRKSYFINIIFIQGVSEPRRTLIVGIKEITLKLQNLNQFAVLPVLVQLYLFSTFHLA